MKTNRHGMGFRQQPDSRDAAYPLASLMAMKAGPKRIPISKAWKSSMVMDQGQTSECVGFGCRLLLDAEPFVWPASLSPGTIYREARARDEFPDDTEGTSVRAGLDVLKEHGFIDAYYWADRVDVMGEYILTRGPVIVGTDWLTGMSNVDKDGFVMAVGRNTGGHCYVATRCNFKEEWIGFQNSWGKSFGVRGSFKMMFYDFEKLLKRGGVAAAVKERIV